MSRHRLQRVFLKTRFSAVCYICTMPRLVKIETWLFGIIHCISILLFSTSLMILKWNNSYINQYLKNQHLFIKINGIKSHTKKKIKLFKILKFQSWERIFNPKAYILKDGLYPIIWILAVIKELEAFEGFRKMQINTFNLNTFYFFFDLYIRYNHQ